MANTTSPIQSNRVITTLDTRSADVTGDGTVDRVTLRGNKTNGFVDDITLSILDGSTNQVTTIPLQMNAGYNPRLFLGDFNNDRVADILVIIESGGSGGFIIAYVITFRNDQPRIIFNSDQFNSQFQYRVTFRNNYRVAVTNITLNKTVILDVSNKREQYTDIYERNGQLKTNVSGEVLPLGGLFPMDINSDGVFELLAVQRVIGINNADTLGYAETVLEWTGTTFRPIAFRVTLTP